MTIGIPLALLWGLHAAANYVPGTGYFRLPILFAAAASCLVWRMFTHRAASHAANRSVTTVGLGCWLVAATLSTIFNWRTEEVVSTYVFVFVSGAAVFVALSGLACTAAALDIAVAGFAAGALFPLVGGLIAFSGEWGSPDVATTISAWHDIVRMNSYTAATFGNRGNTSAFILILAPMLLAVLLDARKRLALRVFCAATMVPVVLNLVVLQIRAAYMSLFVAFVLVWWFKLGVRRLPLMVGVVALSAVLLFKFQPDVGTLMTERILPALTVDTQGDNSVQNRADAISESVDIAARNWLLGIGPGGALTIHSQASAHQFHMQQGMETGILGFLGALLFSVGVFGSLIRAVARGRGDEVNETRFLLLIGPAAYVGYAVISNAALNNGSVNTWTVLLASMLALVPEFEARAGHARAAAPATRSPNLSRSGGGWGRGGGRRQPGLDLSSLDVIDGATMGRRAFWKGGS